MSEHAETPKNFMIRCRKCRWAKITTGTKDDLADLHEVKSNCPTCGKARQFRCPKCGTASKMRRIKRSSVTETEKNESTKTD